MAVKNYSTKKHSVSVYTEESVIDKTEGRWVALARNCSHDEGFNLREATSSGTTMLSHFAILLIGPLSLGTLIISIDGGANFSHSDSTSGQAAISREVVNIPFKLFLPAQSADSKPAEPKARMPDLVPRQRARPASTLSVNQDADRPTDRVLIEEIVISVKKIKEPENAIRPNAPTLLSVQ